MKPSLSFVNRILRCVAGILLGFLIVLPSRSAEVTPKWVSGFYVGWMANSYPPSAIDFSSLSHVMMFSVLPRNDGSLDTSFFGAGSGVAIEVAQRAHAAGKKALLTIGGGGYDAPFRAAASPGTIDAFAQNVVNVVNQYGYDGVDLDWEPILTSDYPAVQSLVNKLRAALPAGSLITADVGWLNGNFPLSSADAQFYASLASSLDQMNIMTYGMADNWGGWLSWHSSAIYGAAANYPSSVEVSVNGYINAGVPAGKLGFGIGFYGSAWNSPVTAPRQSPGSSHVVASDGEFSYANIMSQYYPLGTYHYDVVAQAPYLSFSSPTGPLGCTFISYEDETSVAAKGQFAQTRGLGGVIIWQINEGYRPGTSNPGGLLAAVREAFLGETTGSPTAAFTHSVMYLEVSFTDQSTDSDGTIVSWSWNFGDGTTSAAQHPVHTYVSPGTFNVTLTVTDDAGQNSSTTKSVTVQGPPPMAPTGLTATAASSTRVNLSWVDNASNETGFKIERSTDGVNFSQIATAGANATTYADTTVTEGKAYTYRVRATNGSGDSAYSNTATATTPVSVPAAPTSLSAKSNSRTQINLSWADRSSNEQGFYIERSLNGSAWTQVATLAANSNRYSDSGLAANTTYYYRVQAFNIAGASAYSNTALARTKR